MLGVHGYIGLPEIIQIVKLMQKMDFLKVYVQKDMSGVVAAMMIVGGLEEI